MYLNLESLVLTLIIIFSVVSIFATSNIIFLIIILKYRKRFKAIEKKIKTLAKISGFST